MKKALSLFLSLAMIIIAAPVAMADAGAIELGADANTGVSLSGSLLAPGETYFFPVSVRIDGAAPTPLTDDILDAYNLRIANTGDGSGMADVKLSKIRNVYYISAEVKAGWPIEQTEEEYSFRLSKKGASGTDTLAVSFYTGFEMMPDADIAALERGDDIEVDNDTPVYTAEQLERIGRVNGYRNVVFSGEGWTFTVNVTDNASINMLYNRNAVAELIEKYPDREFEFLTFPAGSKFARAGRLVIDATDLAESYRQTFYVYRYLGGKLTPMPATYDVADDTLYFDTATLGRFVITNKRITDTNVSAGSSGVNPTNPSTGALV